MEQTVTLHAMTELPTIGIEEEFLLVDPDGGAPIARNAEVAEVAARHDVDLQLELTTCQVETATEPAHRHQDLLEQIRHLRETAAKAAAESGAQLLAVALPPTVPQAFPITDNPRYREIADRYGMIAHEQGISACHVHVSVPDRDTAVAVCTWLRPWLPGLLALSANSAIYRGADSGHASWRSVLWHRWPTAGPPPHLESAAEYDEAVQAFKDMGAVLDDGMVYWDARPSAKFPTVELRVADVAATAADAVLLAVLSRAAVMTALTDIAEGAPKPRIPEHLLRAKYWRAARDGLEDRRTLDELGAFVAEITPALRRIGDYDYAVAELERVGRDGNGASRQRRAWQRRGDVSDVLAEVADATLR